MEEADRPGFLFVLGFLRPAVSSSVGRLHVVLNAPYSRRSIVLLLRRFFFLSSFEIIRQKLSILCSEVDLDGN